MSGNFCNFVRTSALLLCLTLFSLAAVLSFATQAIAGTANANELLVFDVDRPITTDDRGFPRNDPPREEANGDWTEPVNFAEGTFHFRVHVRNQPVPQAMRIQFCIWQDNFHLENCGPQANVSGEAETVVTWEKPVQELWQLRGEIIDWSRPRQRYGFAIKNSEGEPVSDYNNWNWNGENPNHWYPLDAQMTVVVVAKGETFSGWHNYIDGLPTPTATSIATATVPPTSTPAPTSTATSTATPQPATATATATATETSAPASPPTSTATPMPAATATAATIAPDAYEPNDACVQASSIGTDATRQEHTMHEAGDVDWVRFNAVAGTTYRIRLVTDADLVAEVLSACEEDTLLQATAASTPDFRFDYLATSDGPLFLQIHWQDARQGGAVGYGLVVREVGVGETVELFLPIVLR